MTLQEIAPIIGIVSLVVAILNFAHTQYQVRIQLAREITALAEQVKQFEAFEHRFAAVEGEVRENKRLMDILWGAIEDNMTKLLMHHNEMGRDKLLAKLRSRTLSYQEALELKAILDVDLAHQEELSDMQVIALPWVMAAVNKAIAITPPDGPPPTPTNPSPIPPAIEE